VWKQAASRHRRQPPRPNPEKAEEGQAQDTSGDEEPAQTQQDEENETSMMTDF